MPLHFLEKYLLPSMQLRKLIETEYLTPGEQPLPGGPETAILYSLYHQTKMTKSSTQDNKLRSLVTHSNDETSSLVKDITESMKAKATSLETYTRQLREITRLPSMPTLCRMKSEDIEERNKRQKASGFLFLILSFYWLVYNNYFSNISTNARQVLFRYTLVVRYLAPTAITRYRCYRYRILPVTLY